MTRDFALATLRGGIMSWRECNEIATLIEQQAERLAELEPLVGSPACAEFFRIRELSEQQAETIRGQAKRIEGMEANLANLSESRCVQVLERELEASKAENERLRKDGERLDWLEKEKPIVNRLSVRETNAEYWHICWGDWAHTKHFGGQHTVNFTLRQAIDAATQPKEGEGKS